MNSPTLQWIRQIGTTQLDAALAVATDRPGNVYICGATGGALESGQHKGQWDVFIAKYDTGGNQIWLRQTGTASADEAFDIAVDTQDNIVISGWTEGELETGQAKGARDAFLAKYDTHGNQLWLRQIGTTDIDQVYGVATDHLDNIFVAGWTQGELETGQAKGVMDAFLAKYDANGNQQWVRQIGTTALDQGADIATDHLGNVFMIGVTRGELESGQQLGATDIFIAKYDTNGNRLWLRQIGTPEEEYGQGWPWIATDHLGNVFISGATSGAWGSGRQPVMGDVDAFLAKYDTNGNQVWLRQFGTVYAADVAYTVATNHLGDVFVCGFSYGDLASGQISSPLNRDAFLAKYDTNGNRQWLYQLGTTGWEEAMYVATDRTGNIFVCGFTQGALGSGQNAGMDDVFLAKFGDSIAADDCCARTEQKLDQLLGLPALITRLNDQLKARSGHNPVMAWTRQIGTASHDEAYSVATDHLGNVFIAGFTGGDLESGQHSGKFDAFLAKYDTSGRQVWLRQIGTAKEDRAYGVATDPMGNIVIGGLTEGGMGRPLSSGMSDIFVMKYDTNGNQLWLKQIGTMGGDGACDIAADELGNVFICGYIATSISPAGPENILLIKYDKNSNYQWFRQLGTAKEDKAYGIATDQRGGIFICGITKSDLVTGQYKGDADAFLAKYDTNGTELWRRQLGTADYENMNRIATDQSGNVFVCGSTEGALGSGPQRGKGDAFIAKYDTNGNRLWLRQFGSAEYDIAYSIATDNQGHVYISGYTKGVLEAGRQQDKGDAFLAKYDTNGARLWLRQFGSAEVDYGRAIAIAPQGHIFVSGYTMGALQSGQRQGDSDVFLAKFTEEESCCQLTLQEVNDLEQLLQGRHTALDLIFRKIN